MRQRFSIPVLFAISLLLCACSHTQEEPEIKELYTVYIDEDCVYGCENRTSACVKWKSDNEPYITGHGTFGGAGGNSGYSLSWTRYFYDTESKVKAYCEKIKAFTVYRYGLADEMDKFDARYYEEHYFGKKYEPVPLD